MTHLIILGERGDEDDAIHMIESMYPLASLVALAAHVEHAKPAQQPHHHAERTRTAPSSSPSLT